MAVNTSLKIRAVRLSATTDGGPFGHMFVFGDGLNVIRGDNTSGKSTTLTAIIYALGMEGMLGPSRRIPLSHSMTDKLTYRGDEYQVLESSVELEIENSRNEVITVRRYVKHSTIDTTLVHVRPGSDISSLSTAEGRDFYVRRTGAAQRDAGFHRFLADFIGWELPSVTRMDGSEIPLYMETLFPYFYVEQKHGWSGIQARMPTYLGIREVGKRSAEFILDLEIFQRILSRQRIATSIAELEAEWKQTLADIVEASDAAGVSLTKMPSTIRESLEDDSASPVVFVGDEWLALEIAIEQLENQFDLLGQRPVPSAGEVSPELEREIEIAERSVSDGLVKVRVVMNERDELRRRRGQLEIRIESLEKDLEKHKDARTLAQLGSTYAAALLADHVCPTCHQNVHDGMDVSSHVMAAEENIAFINRELVTLRAAREDVLDADAALRVRERGTRQEVARDRRRVRLMRETLVSAANVPSVAEVGARIAAQDRLDRLTSSRQQIAALRESLRSASARHKEQRSLLSSVRGNTLEGPDVTKMYALQSSLRNQLQRYGFSSIRPDEVEISHLTYRPSNDGFDLGFDLSASDMIRVIWAYLMAFLRVSVESSGNHLNVLIFDEPKQQDTADESYRQLLQEAASQGARGSQIIFATSEELESLLAMLGQTEFTLHDIGAGEKLLRPLSREA